MEAQIQLEKTLLYLKSLTIQEATQYMKILSKSQILNLSDVFINRIFKLQEETNENDNKRMQQIQDALTVFKFIYKQIEKGQNLYIEDLNFGFTDKLAIYIQKETNQHFFTQILQILTFWITQRNLEMYCFNQNLFKTLSTKFTQQNQQLRDIMQSYDNNAPQKHKRFDKIRQQSLPLYVMPYFDNKQRQKRHNQEKQQDQLHFWLQSIIKLYTKLQDYSLLFHTKDFKILIDIIINLIQNSPSQKILKYCLQLYIILWNQNQKYRIQDVKFILKELKSENNGQFQDNQVKTIIQQIMDY